MEEIRKSHRGWLVDGVVWGFIDGVDIAESWVNGVE
jgi:hypothetical protein